MSNFKITHGFVSQEYDKDGKCISQAFFCGDECNWEDASGNPITEPSNAKYQTYDMVQPNCSSDYDLSHAIAEALEKAAPDGIVVGEDERAVICDVISNFGNVK